MSESGIEELSDSEEEEEVQVKKKPQPKHVDPTPAPTPTPTPTPAPVAVPAAVEKKQNSPTNSNSSPKGGKHIVPREAALKAAEEYQRSGKTREIPKNYLQFQRTWTTLEESEKPSYLRAVPTDKYSDFFKSNISEEVLADIVAIAHNTFVTSGESADSDRAFAIVKQLSLLDRLSALLMFIDSSVTTHLEALPKLLSSHPDIEKVSANLKKRLQS